MISIRKEYQEIQEELNLNQYDYKVRQEELLKKLELLQKKCRHYQTQFYPSPKDSYAKCLDCGKTTNEKIGKTKRSMKRREVLLDEAIL